MKPIVHPRLNVGRIIYVALRSNIVQGRDIMLVSERSHQPPWEEVRSPEYANEIYVVPFIYS